MNHSRPPVINISSGSNNSSLTLAPVNMIDSHCDFPEHRYLLGTLQFLPYPTKQHNLTVLSSLVSRFSLHQYNTPHNWQDHLYLLHAQLIA